MSANDNLNLANMKVGKMLDNAYSNFENWKEIRGFSNDQIRKQFKEFSNGELSLPKINSWKIGSTANGKKKTQRVYMHLVVLLADMMRVNPIELISGRIDVRKL